MTHQDVITLRRAVLQRLINAEGGAYIRPNQNRQPDAAFRIASIRCRGIVGIGDTELAAQSDWFRQSAQKARQVGAQ